MTTEKLRVGAHLVEITTPDKLLYPESGITKREVIDYYRHVAPDLLRHGVRRPLTLHRFPDGIDSEGFYQKSAEGSRPAWAGRISVPLRDGGSQEQAMLESAADLALLGQLATLTLHVWTSRAPDLQRPDRLVFDLDPPDADDFPAVRRLATELRDRLADVGLAAFPLVTGSKGIHVWVPILRGPSLDDVRHFTHAVAQTLAEAHPEEVTTEIRKAKRRGRIFVDVARNALGQTVVAPYSLRARAGAPVATPMSWDELASTDGPAPYDLRSLVASAREDPWKGMGRRAVRLDRAARRWNPSAAAGLVRA